MLNLNYLRFKEVSMKEIVIVEAVRTAVGNFNGSIKNLSASKLGSVVIAELLNRSNIDKNEINEVIMGQVLQAGCGQNPARQAAISAGLNFETPAITINKVCGSSMKAIHYASQAIMLDDADVIIAGGQENMSISPHVLPLSRQGQRLGNWELKDVMLADGLTCALSNQIHMGVTAENIAKKYNISRQEQDEFALESQNKAANAQNNGKFDSQIVDIEIPQRRGAAVKFNKDEFIRHSARIENMQKLRPAFAREGSVTAANASGINDGAAALLIMAKDKAIALGLKPLAKIISYASSGVAPEIMGIGPVTATQKCLKKANWDINDLDIIESNEAFAAQAIAVNKELGWDTNKVNINGGSIAIGHPIGASGSRIITTLLYAMLDKDAKKGLATMCIGGGQGIATAFELV